MYSIATTFRTRLFWRLLLLRLLPEPAFRHQIVLQPLLQGPRQANMNTLHSECFHEFEGAMRGYRWTNLLQRNCWRRRQVRTPIECAVVPAAQVAVVFFGYRTFLPASRHSHSPFHLVLLYHPWEFTAPFPSADPRRQHLLFRDRIAPRPTAITSAPLCNPGTSREVHWTIPVSFSSEVE